MTIRFGALRRGTLCIEVGSASRSGVVGRLSDIHLVFGRHLDAFCALSVPNTPENAATVQMSPDSTVGVRIPPESEASLCAQASVRGCKHGFNLRGAQAMRGLGRRVERQQLLFHPGDGKPLSQLKPAGGMLASHAITVPLMKSDRPGIGGRDAGLAHANALKSHELFEGIEQRRAEPVPLMLGG